MQVVAIARQVGVPSARAQAEARAAEAAAAGLSLYSDPPTGELTLEDFEVLAFERLKLLKAIETAKSRGLKPRELSAAIADALKAPPGKPSACARPLPPPPPLLPARARRDLLVRHQPAPRPPAPACGRTRARRARMR